mmetsp:Transcript_27154/g.44115  ORF Transcript_27154/g.44115 Transcript_27154/m.44115 type:complete len:242 (-) Transcript_27154:154-879(-)
MLLPLFLLTRSNRLVTFHMIIPVTHHHLHKPIIRCHVILPRRHLRMHSRNRLIRLDHPTHRILIDIFKQLLEPLLRPHVPHECSRRISDALGLTRMTFRPIELRLHVRQVIHHRNIVLPRREHIVDVILRGCNMMEEQPGHGELLDRATPRGASPSPQINVIFVLRERGVVHGFSDSDAVLLPSLVLFGLGGGLFSAVHVGGYFYVGPGETVCSLDFEVGLGSEDRSPPSGGHVFVIMLIT